MRRETAQLGSDLDFCFTLFAGSERFFPAGVGAARVAAAAADAELY
jgi:hypothetical protein